MKTLFLAAWLGFSSYGYGADELDKGTKILIKRNCGMCHNPLVRLGGLNLMDQETVMTKKALMINAIESGRMPKYRPDFKDTDDGQKLLDQLKAL